MLFVGILELLFIGLPIYLYIKAWIFTIQSYNLVWDKFESFTTNIMSSPNNFSIAFVTVHIALLVHIGAPALLVLICSLAT